MEKLQNFEKFEKLVCDLEELTSVIKRAVDLLKIIHEEKEDETLKKVLKFLLAEEILAAKNLLERLPKDIACFLLKANEEIKGGEA